MKKILLSMVAAVCLSASAFAQAHSDRITLGVGLLYENGLDATLSWEHETKYHNAWEYFVNGYLKWDECASCGHICPAISNGTNVPPVGISARIPSGKTTVLGA